MGATPEELKQQIDQTRDDLTANVDTLADKVNPASIARRRTASVRRGAGAARERVMGGASAVSSTASGAPESVAARAQGNPLAAGLIAFGAGLLAASLLPTSPAEQQLGAAVKDSSDGLTQPLKRVASEQLQEAKEALTPVAQDAVGQVKGAANQAAQTTAGRAQQARSKVTKDAKSRAGSVRAKAGARS